MAKTVNSTRPGGGLEEFFEFYSNFTHLNTNLGSKEACRQYHDNWIQRYKLVINTWTDYDISVWSVRCRNSLKLSISAAYFALSAKESRKSDMLASSYYFAYYSMMHAMWATIFLLPDQSISNVTDITHSKIANVFDDLFGSRKNSILQPGIKALAEDLRFLREYYSYRMPLNFPFKENENLAQAHIHLDGFVDQSIQLANLHSHLVFKAAARLGKASARIPLENYVAFKDTFFLINGKEHQGRKLKILDPADETFQSECFQIGCDIVPLSIAYDHMFDEYSIYDLSIGVEENPHSAALIANTRSILFNALT